MTFTLLREKRSITYPIVFGIWAEVFLYCLLHDQYLIRIAPAHFTEYHEPLWGISDLTLLAIAWAFRASIGPGLVLGLCTLFVARAGASLPKVAPRSVLKSLPWFIFGTEAAGLAAGAWVWRSERPLYPEAFYPELSLPILVSQTIQLTCYLAGSLLSVCFLARILRKRLSGRSAG